VPIPKAGPGQLLIKVSYSGICGTDVHGFMYDTVPPGTVLGHEFTGDVVEVGEGVTDWSVGDPVVAGGGTAPAGTPNAIDDNPRFNFHTVMEAWKPLRRPEGVTAMAGAMAEPLTTAIDAVRPSGIKLGDTVGVLGGGPIGLFCMQAAKAAGASKVIMSEPAPARAAAARALGADAVIDPTEQDVETEMVALTGGLGPDVIFECAGAKGTLQQALSTVRKGGRVALVALSWEPNMVLPVDWITRDIDLVTSLQHYSRHWEIALDLLARGLVLTEPMVPEGGVIPLSDIQSAFDGLQHPTDEIKVLITP
jgi:threonine dehydrogenase-like Zn-dependent dehydrogenase